MYRSAPENSGRECPFACDTPLSLIPAKARIQLSVRDSVQELHRLATWIPAFAGMSDVKRAASEAMLFII